MSLRYYCYDDGDAEGTLRLLEECFTFFSDTFGRYPYGSYSAVQTGFCYGGMEYPGLVFLSDSLAGADYAYTAVHETAHQWWYAAVGSDQTRAAWMDEGLAEYSSLLYFESAPACGFTREGLVASARRALDAYCTVQQQVFGGVDTAMTRPPRRFFRRARLCLPHLRQGPAPLRRRARRAGRAALSFRAAPLLRALLRQARFPRRSRRVF